MSACFKMFREAFKKIIWNFPYFPKTNPPHLPSMEKNFPLKKSKILRKISRSCRSSSHLDLRNILSVRPHPPYEKNKLLLNKYLGDFMHFQTIFFLRKMTFSNPPTPLKCGKFCTFQNPPTPLTKCGKNKTSTYVPGRPEN